MTDLNIRALLNLFIIFNDVIVKVINFITYYLILDYNWLVLLILFLEFVYYVNYKIFI